MAGTSRRVKIFELSSVLDPGAYMHFPVAEIVSRSKISSLSFNPYIKGQLALANYDGAVQLHDAATQREIRMFEEHARRVWSVDSCIADPTLLASGSDDSTVKLWSMRDPASLSTLSPGSNVCSVRFSPRSSTLLAAGCADGRAYLYDLRRCDSPLARLVGHSRAVSYVSFLSPSTLVTASIDSTLRWALLEHLAQWRPSQRVWCRAMASLSFQWRCLCCDSLRIPLASPPLALTLFPRFQAAVFPRLPTQPPSP